MSGGGRSHVVATLARILSDVAAGECERAELVSRLRMLADRLDGTGATGQKMLPGVVPLEVDEVMEKEKESESKAAVLRLFAYWKEMLEHPAAKLTPERDRVIRARMKDGYSETQLRKAIRGCASSAHHRGQNDTGTKYDDLLLIMRNGSKVEQFSDMARGEERPTAIGFSEGAQAEAVKLEHAALEALERGDTDAFNTANTRLKQLRNGA